MPLIDLQRGPLRLCISPEAGGSVAAFESLVPSRNGGPPVQWLRPATAQALAARDPLGMASFALLPWCNRLRHGRAMAQGRSIVLAPNHNSPHAIHGLGWRLPWQVASRTVHGVSLVLSVPASGWPWAFTAWQDYALEEDGLACTLRLRNDSDGAMPFGLGHHPYFPHEPGTRLATHVQQMWASDADLLPTQLVQPDFLPALARGMNLAKLDLDNNFTGWRHLCRIDWPGREQALLLSAEPPLDYFVLYCPPGLDHFCAEPVSNCTDWLNLPPGSPAGGGVLPAGQTATARWRLQLVPA